MPILAVDEFGRLYETSPDRADGKGYGKHATPVHQGDSTLGAAFLKSGSDQRVAALKDINSRNAEAEKENFQKMQQRKFLVQKHKNEMDQHRLLENDLYKNALLKKGLQMGCNSEFSTCANGNILSANGQSGYMGMDRTQKAIHSRYSNMSMGDSADPVFAVDPAEQKQYEMRLKADALIQSLAHDALARSNYEAGQDKIANTVSEIEVPKKSNALKYLALASGAFFLLKKSS